MRDDFAVFIVSHGRADNVATLRTLDKCGYTGRSYIIVDDEDDDLPKYKQLYGDENVIVFNKESVRGKFDMLDNFEGTNVVVFARNILHDIARGLGLSYFLELDDDYRIFQHRWEKDKSLKGTDIKDFDKIVDIYIEFLEVSGAKTVAFVQGGDMLGGVDRTIWRTRCIRKAMNCFFCSVDRPFVFDGRLNEDANSYIKYGNIGDLYLSCVDICVTQERTQKQKGGLTTSYKKFGTFVKSFYSVMLRPDCTKVQCLNGTGGNNRFHHIINWENAVPKIISDTYKK